jgi:hypothetical protein
LQAPVNVKTKVVSRNFKSKLNAMKKFLLFVLLVSGTAQAQLYVGGQVTFNRKLERTNYTPVNPQISNAVEFGVTGIYRKNDQTKFKAIVSFSDDRFQDDASINVLNNYLGLCAMYSVMNLELKSGIKNSLLFGAYTEGLTQLGIAQPGDVKFTVSENIGPNFKFGIASEYTIELQRSNWLSSISLHTRGDLSQLTILNKNDVIIRDELVRVGLMLNLNKQVKKFNLNF